MLLKYTRPRLLAIWKTLIQSAQLTWEYYEAEVHHTVALIKFALILMLVFSNSSEYVTAESLRAESRVRNNERSITSSADLHRGTSSADLHRGRANSQLSKGWRTNTPRSVLQASLRLMNGILLNT